MCNVASIRINESDNVFVISNKTFRSLGTLCRDDHQHPRLRCAFKPACLPFVSNTKSAAQGGIRRGAIVGAFRTLAGRLLTARDWQRRTNVWRERTNLRTGSERLTGVTRRLDPEVMALVNGHATL